MNENITSPQIKGLTIGLILIVIAIATYFSGIKINGGIQWVGYIVFLIGIIWSINQYGKQIAYASTFGNYFAHGFKVAAVVTFLMIIYIILFIWLFPEFKEKGMEEARRNMMEKNLPEERINQTVEMTRKFFTIFLVGGTLLGYLIFGAVASLIGAAVTKKNSDTFQRDINQIGT